MEIQNPPQSLTRTVPYNQIWMHQDLLFSQTCGYPFVSRLWDQVKDYQTLSSYHEQANKQISDGDGFLLQV